jgi:hypothetical protein
MTAPATTEIDLDRLRSDLRRYSDIAEVRFDAAIVDRVIATLAPLLTTDSWVGMRTTTKPPERRDLNLRLIYPHPLPAVPLLREAGLLTYQGHPIERLGEEIASRFGVWWGIDASVKGMADKVWLQFADGIALAEFLTLDSLPPAVHGAGAHFARAGLDSVGMVALDFTSHTVNVYAPVFPPGTLTRERVEAIIGGLGFPLPADDELARDTRAFCVYQTFSWDSPDLQRLCFPVGYLAADFPVHYHPLLRAFVEQGPLLDEDVRGFGFYTAYGPRGSYYKVSADYTGNHQTVFARHRSPGLPAPA